MKGLGIDTPRSGICHTIEGAEKIAAEIGFPLVVRPAYTMGGQGGGFCYNVEELRTIVANGLDLSMTHQCLIEESILGWEELEVEVVRDAKNQMIAICFIENIRMIQIKRELSLNGQVLFRTSSEALLGQNGDLLLQIFYLLHKLLILRKSVARNVKDLPFLPTFSEHPLGIGIV